uniref:Cytohesin 4 n=1 Tax=Xenopus tropicalis TaxID=8364 RepID=A0A803KDP6_XENTR
MLVQESNRMAKKTERTGTDGCLTDNPPGQTEQPNIKTESVRSELLEHIKELQNEITDIVADIDDFERLVNSRKTQRENELLSACRKFNMAPEKGIQLLIEKKFVEKDPSHIASFLFHGEGLSKTAIGEYLGERDVFNIQVLQAFVDCHSFTKLNLVEALRQFLGSFRLPGEAQKIDRMMESFSAHYCQCNPGTFQSTDSCYIVSFSLIILNTSLHNPSIKERLQREHWGYAGSSTEKSNIWGYVIKHTVCPGAATNQQVAFTGHLFKSKLCAIYYMWGLVETTEHFI